MPFIASSEAPRFDMHGASFIGLASPTRGSMENAVWIVTLPPGTPPKPHQLTREEIFVGLEGRARAEVGGQRFEITPGSSLIVPPGIVFTIENVGETPFKAVAVLPVGGQALVAGQEAFTPPWAA
jgi:mannose-6-phosphate isomerase-like protein (cupin superfamily)